MFGGTNETFRAQNHDFRGLLTTWGAKSPPNGENTLNLHFLEVIVPVVHALFGLVSTPSHSSWYLRVSGGVWRYKEEF